MRSPRLQQIEDIRGPKKTPALTDYFQLLLEDGSAAVTGEDHECANGALAGVEIFVQASGWEMSVQSSPWSQRER